MPSPPESRRAVVIEDDPDIRGLLVRVLVKQGLDVIQAAAGMAGVEEVRRVHPDLVASGLNPTLIEALVTTMTFERQDGTNTWVLTRTSQHH